MNVVYIFTLHALEEKSVLYHLSLPYNNSITFAWEIIVVRL